MCVCPALTAVLSGFLLVLVLAPGHTGAEDRNGLMIANKENTRLEAYLEADTKYRVVPVPAPIDRAQATGFVTSELSQGPDAENTEKLSRLAVLHDLRDTAKGFQTLLRVGPPSAEGALRSVACLTALAWLGNPDQFTEAVHYYVNLLGRVDWESQRPLVLRAAYSLGPQESTENLKSAVRSAISSLQTRLQELKKAPTKTPAEIDVLESRQDRLEEFLNLEIPRLEQANAVRVSIDAMPEDKRIALLCGLYLGNSARATPPQVEWAAYKLVRLNAKLHPSIAKEFLAQAALNHQTDPDRQTHFDLVRARSLRAAEYFGAILEAPMKLWLVKQKDHGTDLLALRPDWEYPQSQK